jgi:hypothetical protein
MIFRADRTRRDDDPWLLHKQVLFIAGALIAMLGIAVDRAWVINTGIAVLAVGFLLRFAKRKKPSA